MGKVDYFVVDLRGEKRDYFPGEIICGDVLLKNNKEIKLREIRLEFYGEAKVYWTETTRKKKRGKVTGPRDYTNYEQYLNIATTVYGKAPGQLGDNPVLPAGDHSFPFEFRIPEENLPTTLEGKHGHVTYWLKAIVDRPWKSSYETRETFTITERVDVNDPELLRPCQLQEDRNLGCLCCVSGPLSVTVQTDRGGYCSGEVMTVTAYVNNQTSFRITGVELELIQNTVFISSGGKRNSITDVIATVIKAKKKAAAADINDWFEMVPLTIPSLPPTMRSCSCIQISYCIKFTVLVRGSVNSCLYIPITIGSIPYQSPSGHLFSSFKGSSSHTSSMGPFSGPPSFPSGSLMFTDGIRPYPNEAPPSYAESMSSIELKQDKVFYNKGMDMESFP